MNAVKCIKSSEGHVSISCMVHMMQKKIYIFLLLMLLEFAFTASLLGFYLTASVLENLQQVREKYYFSTKSCWYLGCQPNCSKILYKLLSFKSVVKFIWDVRGNSAFLLAAWCT